MDFDLNEDQRLLKDSVERLLADRYDFETRKRYMQEPEGWDRKMWSAYAELGLLGLPFAEKHGGFGGGAVEMMIIAEAFGRALALEPYLATVVLSGGCVRLGASERMQSEILPKLAEGNLLLALAHFEPQARYDLADVETAARRDGEGYVIDGTKSLVLHGDAADKFVVSARLSGASRDPGGIGLFLVDAQAPGVSRRGYRTVDGLHAAEISLSGVRAGAKAVIGEPGEALPLIERVADAAIAFLAAEAVGAMTATQEMTVEYLKTRKQFGAPIGSFQALQHRAADMLVMLEQARSMAYYATMMADEADALERRKAISAAKVQIGRSARFVGQQAIQLHGGMGMTMEYKVGHYFKRMTMIDTLFGDADHHLGIVSRLGGLIPA